MGLKSFFKPLARIWARYLESLERRERASLGLSAKFLMMARSMSSSRELAWARSFLVSNSLRLI